MAVIRIITLIFISKGKTILFCCRVDEDINKLYTRPHFIHLPSPQSPGFLLPRCPSPFFKALRGVKEGAYKHLLAKVFSDRLIPLSA